MRVNQRRVNSGGVEFMYLVFTRMPGESVDGCTSDGVYIPCILHAVSVDGCTSDGVYTPCILHARHKTVGDSGL